MAVHLSSICKVLGITPNTGLRRRKYGGRKVRGGGRARRRLRWGRRGISKLPFLRMHSQEAKLGISGQKYRDSGRGCQDKGHAAPTRVLVTLSLWVCVKVKFGRFKSSRDSSVVNHIYCSSRDLNWIKHPHQGAHNCL